MTDVYTAPTNGHEIRPTNQGGLRINLPGMDYVGGHGTQNLVAGRVGSLREYFRDERDRELGRWRWPENQNYVVYPGEDGSVVLVFCETTGEVYPYYPDDDFSDVSAFGNAAKAYFDTHPVKKPWHDAKPGEVWALSVDGETRTFLMTTGGYFTDEHFSTLSPDCFTAGQCIWPESKES